jgi:lysozyme
MAAAKGKVGAIAALAVILAAAPFVAKHEGIVTRTYVDPVGIRTACGGETDRSITMRERFTRDECVAVMGASLYAHALAVDKCITRPLATHEAVAVLSWSYNVGTGAACKSTLVKMLNAGAPASAWCAQLLRWDKARKNGRLIVLPGLKNRRVEEYGACLGRP